MQFLPITLGARRERVRQDGSGAEQGMAVADKTVRAAVLSRDRYTCQFCGFTSKKYQTVRQRPDAKSARGAEAFVAACAFCEQCFSLDAVGLYGGGLLIWLPEISQAQLNHIVRAIYIARSSEEASVAEAAQVALDALMVRRYEARRRVGSDDPLILATVLCDLLTDQEYTQRIQKLEGLRLLPMDRRVMRRGGQDINIFPDMLAYWKSAEGPFAKTQPREWMTLLESVTSKTGNA